MICMKNMGGLIMNLFKRIVSSALALSIVTSAFSTDVFASEEIIEGQILFEDGSPAVGIKINILTSAVDEVYDNDIVGFANNYYTSVYTDSNGNYEFVRPSDYCLVEVDLDSLPSKTGVSSESSFLYPGETVEPFTVYQIADVSLSPDNDIAVYNDKGDTIFSRIEVDNTDSTIKFADLLNSDIIEISQDVNANDFKIDFETKLDMSDYPLIEKADALFNMNLIDKETKVLAYLSAVRNNELSGLECATPIYDELISYYDDNHRTKLGQQIAQTLSATETGSPSVMAKKYSNEATVTVGRFVIHFESNTNEDDYMSSSDLSQVVQYVRNIDKVFFTDFGFKDPAYEKGKTKCHIYFAQDVNSATLFTGNSDNPSGYGRYITIQYNKTSTSLADARETTLAHEIFHTIQQSYKTKTNKDLKWATEASATWASLRYYNRFREKAVDRAYSYLKDTTRSFSTFDNGGYGLFLFFQYISQKYGDSEAIKRILEAFTDSGDIYSAVEHCHSRACSH